MTMPIRIELDEVRRLLAAEGAQLLDVLGRSEYEESHLPDAVHVSLKELDAQSAARLDRDRPVVAYCADDQ
jgi:rhodanese-related sulfurtransferase